MSVPHTCVHTVPRCSLISLSSVRTRRIEPVHRVEREREREHTHRRERHTHHHIGHIPHTRNKTKPLRGANYAPLSIIPASGCARTSLGLCFPARGALSPDRALDRRPGQEPDSPVRGKARLPRPARLAHAQIGHLLRGGLDVCPPLRLLRRQRGRRPRVRARASHKEGTLGGGCDGAPVAPPQALDPPLETPVPRIARLFRASGSCAAQRLASAARLARLGPDGGHDARHQRAAPAGRAR